MPERNALEICRAIIVSVISAEKWLPFTVRDICGNRSHPGVAVPSNWASRHWQNQRHLRHVAVAITDYAGADCRSAA